MPRSCAYCGYMIGNTKDHIFPKSVIRACGISNDNSRNIVYACTMCNREKRTTIYIPTPTNLRDKFINFTTDEVCRFANYLYQYRNQIISYYERTIKMWSVLPEFRITITGVAKEYEPKPWTWDLRIEYLEFLIFCKYYEFGFYNEENISKYVKGRV